MEATFYGVLGVGPDADEETVVRAYRERSKSAHPDVSDDPDAGERFKRLTTAKEVLTDETERARYDRLGHETYVRRNLEGMCVDDGTDTGGVSEAARQYVAGGGASTGSSGSAARGRSGPSATTAQRPRQTRGGATGYGTAADYYRPGQRVGSAETAGAGSVLASFRRVGPWLFVHLALFACTVAVALLLAVGGLTGRFSPVVAGVMALSTVSISLLVSATHVLSRLSA
ncbi:DnaJ domain-containing protein [Haloarcula salina]|uniref:DnaJ domain-containing protein n=1 Tax=Haloarcula salina TaxID=1429914 RepID=A0AA41G0Q5_9EURY|nr:DnaJ domain-containing protein [Haloarcula salina]MBV0901233.1 DnaJ domain-containing protein [Haloarcula salina]